MSPCVREAHAQWEPLSESSNWVGGHALGACGLHSQDPHQPGFPPPSQKKKQQLRILDRTLRVNRWVTISFTNTLRLTWFQITQHVTSSSVQCLLAGSCWWHKCGFQGTEDGEVHNEVGIFKVKTEKVRKTGSGIHLYSLTYWLYASLSIHTE